MNKIDFVFDRETFNQDEGLHNYLAAFSQKVVEDFVLENGKKIFFIHDRLGYRFPRDGEDLPTHQGFLLFIKPIERKACAEHKGDYTDQSLCRACGKRVILKWEAV